ncbi:MAG: SOS response-associated peptidase family protein [Burkholderiaceae bacterium]
MCTNYVPSRGSRLTATLGLTDPGLAWRNEVWPGHLAPMIRRPHEPADDVAQIVPACFGLIPGWSRDGRNYRHCYNARSETVAEKPSFRHAWRRGQFCLVPADAFFEPNYESGRPVRWRIAQANGEPMSLAGIWDAWRRPDTANPGNTAPMGPADAATLAGEWLLSFSLLTINADGHDMMGRFHAPGDEKRSVVIISGADRQAWLNAPPEQARQMLRLPAPGQLVTEPAPRRAGPPRQPAPPRPRRRQQGQQDLPDM